MNPENVLFIVDTKSFGIWIFKTFYDFRNFLDQELNFIIHSIKSGMFCTSKIDKNVGNFCAILHSENPEAVLFIGSTKS